MEPRQDTRRGDSMVEYVLSGREGKGLVSGLAAEFRRGYPLDRLFLLLDSEDPEVAVTGAMIASEIGKLVAPIADRLCPYLSHPTPWVRSDIADALLNSGPPYSRQTLTALEALTIDENDYIRRKAQAFVETIGPAARSPDGDT